MNENADVYKWVDYGTTMFGTGLPGIEKTNWAGLKPATPFGKTETALGVAGAIQPFFSEENIPTVYTHDNIPTVYTHDDIPTVKTDKTQPVYFNINSAPDQGNDNSGIDVAPGTIRLEPFTVRGSAQNAIQQIQAAITFENMMNEARAGLHANGPALGSGASMYVSVGDRIAGLMGEKSSEEQFEDYRNRVSKKK